MWMMKVAQPVITDESIKGLIFMLILMGVYFLPSIIAAIRRHHNGISIALLNLFLGWTFIGWLIALIWACSSPPPQSQIIIQQDFSDRYARPAWEHEVQPRRPPVILPPTQLPDHLFDKRRED